ncbi:alpha-2-macroglobulin [Winogradskyella sp. J14-2]|uniref:alpha-2-macroglobulin family protein n=1 Tax=Winogradskyella sp. J14-2 TaxID=1936080 RepID=UPI0009726C57|nr:alpha-2-macroglobulin family protein [Winogradskyella sp. J14-2]APY09687.1 alpha-2-macroglobulin [Winogradskyella sp. J14-2]
MKNYIPILMLICFASFSQAQDNLDDLWKKVIQLENEGLTKSAAELVDTIYKNAKSSKNKQQQIKALLHKSKYMLILEEDAQLNIVNIFKSEIEATKDIPAQRLLENMLATMYWQYFQQNRYKFYNRSKTEEKVSDDFRTWDLETLFNEIHVYYQRSLKNGLLLQQESLENYSVLLNEYKNSKIYRPTLFDLLSHNALQFYKTDENSITKPAYQFKIDNPSFLDDSEVFINLKLSSKDSTNLELNTLKVYQNLLKFHRKDKQSKAFVNVDIERLNFVLQHATFDKKEDVLIKTLTTNAEALKASPLSALYNYETANLYQQQGFEYDSEILNTEVNEKNRWKNKEAIDLCNKVIAAFPESDGAKKCEILKQQILQPSLGLQAEEFISVNTPSRILVNYKNLAELDFNIYKVDINQLEIFNKKNNTEQRLEFFSKLKPIHKFTSNLKSEDDFQQHSTEIVIPKLANGFYLIKADTNKDNVFAVTHIQITDFALLERIQNEAIHYQLINRNNGEPISDASIKIFYTNNRNKSFSKNLKTDRFGKFNFKKDRNYYRQVEIKVDHNNNEAYFGDYYFSRAYKPRKNTDTQYNVFLFTDRSIYRPGQTAYFKGIVTATKNDKTEVYANEKATVRLKNVNGEVVSEQALETNEFGSVAGEFILPNDGLTGSFTIEMVCGKKGYTYFSVEEYKRPKFKPEFQPITETFKVNDSITVNGKAVAFAGSNITDAKVVYRVKRQVQYPSWWYWRRPDYYSSEAQEITFGEGTTNDKGEFEITFKALPDESVSKDNLPVFNYEVTADITDINGETRSTSTVVNVGYHAMTLEITNPNQIDKTKKEVEISLNSKNLNGQEVPAKGTLKIYKLQAPDYVLRARPWDAPDFQIISKEEFKRIFPHDPYNDEHLSINWDKGEEVFSTNFDTEKQKTITLKKLKKWNSGQYIIIAESKDKFGADVKAEAYTNLFSEKDKTVADHQLFEATLDKDSYKAGDVAKLTIGSAAKDITVTVEVEKDNNIIVTQLVKLNNSKQTISIPVLEDDLGGFEVHTSFAAYNSYVYQSFRVNVPYPKTDLEIETTTFRDKLQPGQDETWSFKIKGPKGDKVSAELLASMYDASLDEFRGHNWSFSPIKRPYYNGRLNKNGGRSFGTTSFRLFNRFAYPNSIESQSYDQLDWFGLYFGYGSSRMRSLLARAPGVKYENYKDTPEEYLIITEDEIGNVEVQEADMGIEYMNASGRANDSVHFKSEGKFTTSDNLEDPEYYIKMEKAKIVPKKETIQIRKNLNETAFFFPQLQTNEDGNVSFNFKAPEALTKWKLQLLAHTKTLESSVKQLEAVTQKELMVIPNAPRFLREGDQITISTKIANLTEKELSGIATLVLTDAITGSDISYDLVIKSLDYRTTESKYKANEAFSVDAKGNTQVSWSLAIPKGLQAVQYQIIAKSGDFSDGEQNALPVLSNRMLVTETLPMWIRSNETKTFTLDKLAKLGTEALEVQENGHKNVSSSTLRHHKLTLEMTSNPAWYAVQALPYLMEYPYDCNEQTFSRYYANALAQHIVTSNPKIEAVFNQWASSTSANSLLSNLEKNQELKSLLIQETPWLRDAQSETEQKKRIGLLFDLNKMNNELNSALRKLKQNQLPSGAWPWFNGGYANRFITQHIISGFGHLKHLSVTSSEVEMSMIKNAIQYLDTEFVKEYKDIKKYNKDADLSKDHLSYTQLHYMYVRSFYPEVKASKEVETIMDYYKSQMQKYWLKRSLYAKGLMTLTLHRMNDDATAGKILKSLKENSITSDELGMYWKANTNSWYWHQAPIETQALLIEAFSEVGVASYDVTLSAVEAQKETTNIVDNLKIWLLKNKQTNKWKTTKATTEAVYALLLQGISWLDASEMVDVKVGNETINPSTLDNVKVEAGTGYYKTSWTGEEITAEQANVTISKKGDGIAWGALYWQYFEDLDKITSAETPLKLSKKLFLKSNTDKGEEISEINKDTKLNVGDLVRVRIELRSDRDMEFVHLKDMRAAGFEPINVLSQYKWQDGLGYYESTKDAATNFFMDYLPKGVYVFEYDLRVNNAGDMSNGISTIQSMYAPEFSSHSEGVRVTVE